MKRIGLGSGFTNSTSFKLGPKNLMILSSVINSVLIVLISLPTLYYMRLRSEISTTDNSFYNRNLAPTERYGIENNFKYSFMENLNIENAFTLTQAKFRGGDRNENDLPGVPAFCRFFTN